MPLTKHALELPTESTSVRLARRWVTEILTGIGREDLVDTAELGVSELVTNAIIHGEPPFAVRVRGTFEYPRIEVRDSSPIPPRRATMSADTELEADAKLATHGRGLRLVAMASKAWGANLDHTGTSKVVWFVPGLATDIDCEVEGDVYVLDEPPLRDAARVSAHDHVIVRLVGFPAQDFGELRRYQYELRREMRLLAMTAAGRYPVARWLTQLFTDLDRERVDSVGFNQVDQAIAEDAERADVIIIAPRSSAKTMKRLRKALRALHRTFDQENLLAIRPAGHLLDLQTWFLSEFVRQGRGAEAISWPEYVAGVRDRD